MKKLWIVGVALAASWGCGGFGSAEETSPPDAGVNGGDAGGGPDAGGVVVGTPQQLSLALGDVPTAMVVQGRTAKVSLAITHGPGVDRAIHLAFKAPSGIAVKDLDVPVGATAVDVDVSADAARPQGAVDLDVTLTSDTTTGRASGAGKIPLFVRGPAGALDTTFGNAGVQGAIFAGMGDPVGARALANGDLVVSGGVGTIDAVKILADGKVGPSFPITGAMIDVLPDGRVLALGIKNGDSHPTLSRYLPTGALDTTFGGTGTITAAIGTESSPYQVAALPSGKILVLAHYNYIDSGIAVSRWNVDGTLDTTYGDAASSPGYCPMPYSNAGPNEYTKGVMMVRADGSVVVAANERVATANPSYDVVVHGCTPAGAPDVAWGVAPRYTKVLNLGTLDAAADYDGKRIVVAYDTIAGSRWVYVSTSGADTAHASAQFPGSLLSAIAVDHDGNVILGGSGPFSPVPNQQDNWIAARYTPSGSLDDAFADHGVIQMTFTKDLNLAQSQMSSVLVATDGRILLLGSRFDTENGAVARFWN